MIRRFALVLLLLTMPAQAQDEVVADLSQNRISINTNFDGSEILVFGAVLGGDRGTGMPPPGVIVTVSGPRLPIMVRRKSRVAGIWVNTTRFEIDQAPAFYAVATNRPLAQILSQTEDLRHSVTTERAIRAVGSTPEGILDSGAFTDALVRLREGADLYQLLEGEVGIVEETLFSTSITLPANLVEGNYTVRILLTRDQEVVSTYENAIFVQKVGLERFLYNLAHEQPVIYGIVSLIIAMAAGWAASAAFRYMRS